MSDDQTPATRAPQAPPATHEPGSEGEVGGEAPRAAQGRTGLRDAIAEALTREHHQRAQERIEASPEDHSAAFADAVLEVVQPELDRLAAQACDCWDHEPDDGPRIEDVPTGGLL